MDNLLTSDDLSRAELETLLELAAKMKREYMADNNRPLLRGKTLGMIFQNPSLRTRVSFHMAMRHLGGSSLYISPQEVGLGKRESVADVARVLSGYVGGIMARVFAGYVGGIMARVFAHKHLLELAEHASVPVVPVINGLSDYNHPCQAFSDIFTVMELRPHLQGLKMAFVGDGNNVATSLLLIGARLWMHFSIASPDGYELDAVVAACGRKLAAESGSDFQQMHDPDKTVVEADIIYTDVWTSMEQEEEFQQRRRAFRPYQVNRRLLARARPDVLVMHDLPAHRGEEITDAVADGPHSVIFPQAHNRQHAQKAILAQLLGQ